MPTTHSSSDLLCYLKILIKKILPTGLKMQPLFRRAGHGDTYSLFSHVELEISSLCNLKCASCPNATHKRPVAELSLNTIERLLKELADMRYKGTFSPHFYNEPLVDKRLDEILKLVRHILPQNEIILFTNFTLMTPTRYRELLPLVDEFVVSVDEPIIKQAVETISEKLSKEEKMKLRTRSLSEGGALSNRAGNLDVPEATAQRPNCSLGRDYLIIDAQGDVHLCCNDYKSEAVFGNIHTQSILAIWTSREFQAARKQAYHSKHQLCTDCFWSADN